MLKDETIITEALKIVKEAKNQGVHLRIMGAIAIRLHTKKFTHLLTLMERKLTDIDLVGYSTQAKMLPSIFQRLGYEQRPTTYALYLANRRIFYKKDLGLKVDVFLDKLIFCHTIDLRGRLELDYPTLTPTDLFLEKAQIVQITEKDLKDLIALLREHEIKDKDDDCINGKYIAKILANDWGFYYTVKLNLDKLKNYLSTIKAISEEDKSVVLERIKELDELIEKEPKSLKWKLRSTIGPKKKWYREVETIT